VGFEVAFNPKPPHEPTRPSSISGSRASFCAAAVLLLQPPADGWPAAVAAAVGDVGAPSSSSSVIGSSCSAYSQQHSSTTHQHKVCCSPRLCYPACAQAITEDSSAAQQPVCINGTWTQSSKDDQGSASSRSQLHCNRLRNEALPGRLLFDLVQLSFTKAAGQSAGVAAAATGSGYTRSQGWHASTGGQRETGGCQTRASSRVITRQQ
jgi:hypothetical protein